MWWCTSSGIIELNITKEQASIGSHQGQCDDDIEYLLTIPAIRRQIDKLDPDLVAEELSEYGAWDTEELQDHEQNKRRLLWIACGDIQEGN
jgi:hypothetical protein